ncbi:hypothetical protein ETG59_11845 [Proteus mirabilis]|uniref:hypothetical protein n=1 Tax=Proteus mirabilis TaxID=584 RepID=UPI0019D0A635|nr:hypothetical protein [Proteus mirabilis]MBI6486512.1 hypothetical protein [Proteus mirabilis]MBN7151018.1 hypothetical protein [Proteus mirabilis]MBN7154565.1 hypothetical protein [Proteus mirabilis]MBN7167328.1 hypothetical protein [Proteus mirabilis]MBN7171026.1 hypothetical protein [Proteus mirabilis]
MRSTDNIIRIIDNLSLGSNLTINGTDKSTDNLIRIAKACVNRNIHLTVQLGNGHSTDNVIRLVKSGGDYINIELF